MSVLVAIWTGVKKVGTETWGQIGTRGATISQLYQSLMESSQWQYGNYSTGCVMLAWHLLCHRLCPCKKRNIDQWQKRDENISGTGKCLLVTSCILFWQYDATSLHYIQKPDPKKDIFTWLLCLTQFDAVQAVLSVRLLHGVWALPTVNDTETVIVSHLQCSLFFGSRP